MNAATAGPSPLITPVHVGQMNLKHRVVMSPMTRLRNAPGTELPREINQTYYEERASDGGLVITECLHVSKDCRGYVRSSGLFTNEQVAAWAKVAETVHGKGGYVYAQVFHPGRIAHSSLNPDKLQIVSASAIAARGELYVDGGVKKPYETPRALDTAEVPKIVEQFASAAKNAMKAGFDGVEIHAGNGYLIQQFLAKATNTRTDKYGGTVENRCRFLLEIVDACAAEIGSERLSVKLQQGVSFSDLVEPQEDVLAQLDYLGPALFSRKLAYVCQSSLNGAPYFQFVGLQAPNVTVDVFKYMRDRYKGTLMINGGLSVEQGDQYVQEKVADLVCYGVPFIANANLPALIAAGYKTADLNPAGFNPQIWYSKDPAKDEEGYIDFPLVTPVAKA